MAGISARQGGHHVAHKLTSTACPRRSESLTVSPSNVCDSKSVGGKESLLWCGDLPGGGYAGSVGADKYPRETEQKNERINDFSLNWLHSDPFSATLLK
jgi:hypothetical protein